MEYEIQQPPEQSIPLHNFLSESSCPNPIAVTRKHTTPDSSSSTVDYHWVHSYLVYTLLLSLYILFTIILYF